jgi:hypothetical protein
LEKIRIKKSEERGGFDKNLFLIDTSKSWNSEKWKSLEILNLHESLLGN